MWHQEMYHKCDAHRRSPGRYRVSADREIRVLSVCLDRLHREEQENKDACADSCRIAAEDEALEEGVEAAWEQAEGSGEQDEGYDRAILGFEALEERYESAGVQEEVKDRFMEEWEGVQSVDCNECVSVDTITG